MGNFGKYLRERRTDKGISTEYVALHTPLNEKILAALENEDYAFFNSSFYFSNFLNSYLDFLGIDRDRFYSDFSADLETLKNSENVQIVRSLTGLRYSKFRNRAIIIRGIILGIMLAILFYLLFINKGFIFSLFEQERVQVPETGTAIAGFPEREADFSPVNLSLKFSDDCWMRAFRGNQIIAEKIFTTGEHIRIRGYDLKLMIGNPSVVDISINNKRTEKYKHLSRTAVIRITPQTVDKII